MMRWHPILHDIWDGARRHPVRVALPFAGIALGMAALTTLLALVVGLQRQTDSAIAELGVNVFTILQEPTAAATPLTRRHIALLQTALPDATVTGIRTEQHPINATRHNATILGADEQAFAVRPWSIRLGRPLDSADVRDHSAVAVISETLARELHLGLGHTVTLGPVVFRIVGITTMESGTGEAGTTSPALTPGERLMVVPWTVPPYWRDDPTPPDDRLDAIFVRSRQAETMAATLQTARHLLADPRHKAAPLSWLTPWSLVDRLLHLRRLIMLAGGAIVALCLLMGGITLGSLMLSNIQTRIPEIGLRRALGASRLDISLLFLLEALLLTLSATILGAGTAVTFLAAGSSQLPIPVAMGPFLILIPLAAGLLLGLVFSYLPAKTAAQIAPAEALRNE
jgi:ABC-type antimicrobial peptide transport system permease subunit